jgi:hypothetical protein
MNDCFERLKEETILCSKDKSGNMMPVEQESRIDQGESSDDGSHGSNKSDHDGSNRNGN